MTIRFYLFLFLSLIIPAAITAQPVYSINDSVGQHIFTFQGIEYLEDPTAKLTLADILAHHQSEFTFSTTNFNPENVNPTSAYWHRIRIQHNKASTKQWVLEFFDQTIDKIDLYIPDGKGSFKHFEQGDQFEFTKRMLRHKNFIFPIDNNRNDVVTYYFRVQSQQQAEVIVVLRSADYLMEYALDEYFFFGIFYGMILVFIFYNLLMYFAVRESHYIFYMLYLIGIGLYEMSADGIGFQYLWPRAVEWNQYAPGFTLYLASSAALLFASSVLNLRKDERWLFRLLMLVLVLRTVFLILSVFVFTAWFSFRFVEIIPFSAALFAGIYRWKTGYKAARFLVIAYAFLFYGALIKVSLYFNFTWMPFGQLSHYSLSFGFVMEMLFLSFAISDKIRLLRIDKEVAQERTIEQLHENQRLKDNLNQELEMQVKVKTAHIEQQKEALEEANRLLAQQAAEIAAMNALLERDNDQLKHDVAEVKEARILSKDVDFEEFSAMYPDDASCLKFLAERKWHDHFSCRKCSNTAYSEGKSLYARRCTRCGYEESVTAYTLLQNTRLPINKAFYMIFLVYSSKGSISSHKLSELLHIRQSTCWAYSNKIKKAMKERRRISPFSHHEGWDALLLMEEVSA